MPNDKLFNQLLASLSESAYQRLSPHLRYVSLEKQQPIYEGGEQMHSAYFPCRSIISIVSIMNDGAVTEVGLVGSRGMIGLPIILGDGITPYRVFTQVSDGAWQIRADRLRNEFERGGELQKLLLLYTQSRLAFTAQSTACNSQHTVDKRLARWLLIVQNDLQTERLPLTQELIASMLGVRRAGVSEAAIRLQETGSVRYTRGLITVLDRQKLEACSCECYQVMESEYQRLIGVRASRPD